MGEARLCRPVQGRGGPGRLSDQNVRLVKRAGYLFQLRVEASGENEAERMRIPGSREPYRAYKLSATGGGCQTP